MDASTQKKELFDVFVQYSDKESAGLCDGKRVLVATVEEPQTREEYDKVVKKYQREIEREARRDACILLFKHVYVNKVINKRYYPYYHGKMNTSYSYRSLMVVESKYDCQYSEWETGEMTDEPEGWRNGINGNPIRL